MKVLVFQLFGFHCSCSPSEISFSMQELKNNKIEEDLDRGLSGAGHHLASLGSQGVPSMQVGSDAALVSFVFIVKSKNSHFFYAFPSQSLHSGPSSLGSLQPSLSAPLR